MTLRSVIREMAPMLSILFIAMIYSLLADTLAAEQTPVFRSATRGVPVYATVIGPDGRMLLHLDRDAFTVLDNGQVRPISVFSNDPAPIVGLTLWDVTSALGRHRHDSWQAALALVQALWAEDRIRFGTFSFHEFFVSPVQTGNKATLRRIVEEELWFTSGISIPLWAALSPALKILATDEGRRVLVLLTAGKSEFDPGSWEDVVRQVQRTDAMIYVIGFRNPGLTRKVRELAEESGGGYAELPEGADLGVEFERIVAELHHQYLIGFVSNVSDGSLRTVEVRVNVPGAKVRARRSYVAAGVR